MLLNPELRIENTNLCNAKCVICPREKMTRKLEVMPTEHFENLVKQACSLGTEMISIFGYGEPLMDSEIVDKLKLARNFTTFITTNASLLTTDLSIKLLNAGLNKIRFSVHGWDKNYEKVHGLNYETTKHNIENFVRINKNCHVSYSVIPMFGESVEEIKDMYQGCELEIWKPHNWTDGRAFRGARQRKLTCGRPFNGPVQINADGKIMVCCFDYDGKMIVGDTYKDSIEDIVKGDRFNAIREAHREGNLKGLPCETCDQLNIGDNPLLYSTIEQGIGKTSSIKFKLREI